MSKLKKVLLMCTAYVLVAALAIGGTIAYLQDSDSDVNVMTLGNVSIEQHEYQRAEGVAHDAGEPGAGNGVKEGALVEFVQNQKLYPAVPKNGAATDYTAEMDTANLFFWGDYVYSGTAGNGLWNDNKLSNVMDKMVFVENTGKTDAYIRTLIAFECPEGITIGEPSQGAEIMINTNIGTYDWEDVGYITVDGVRYAVMTATYKKVLAPGNQSHPSLLQVVMTHHATNEDMELLGDTYEILVLSQAVQAEGFTDAKTALDTAFGKITDDSHPFSTTIYITTNDEAKFLNALVADAKVIILTDIVDVTLPEFDGKGEEVTLAGVGEGCYGYLSFTPGLGNPAEVNNLNVTGSGFVEIGHADQKSKANIYVAENLSIKDMTATLCLPNGGKNIAAAFAHYGTATLKNCVMTGTVAAKDGYTNYDASFVNGTDTTIEGGEYGRIYMANQAAITIKGAKVGLIEGNPQGIVSKNTGAKLEIQAGAKVDKIDVAAYNNTYTLNDSIIIRAGAEVDTLILNMRNCTRKTILNIEDGGKINHLIIDGVEVDYNTWKNS